MQSILVVATALAVKLVVVEAEREGNCCTSQKSIL